MRANLRDVVHIQRWINMSKRHTGHEAQETEKSTPVVWHACIYILYTIPLKCYNLRMMDIFIGYCRPTKPEVIISCWWRSKGATEDKKLLTSSIASGVKHKKITNCIVLLQGKSLNLSARNGARCAPLWMLLYINMFAGGAFIGTRLRLMVR